MLNVSFFSNEIIKNLQLKKILYTALASFRNGISMFLKRQRRCVNPHINTF